MKTLGLIVVLSLCVLAMILVLLPLGITMDVQAYPQAGETTMGKARVGEITIHNDGWFTQTVRIPEYTACIGEQEIPLDAWIAAGTSVVRGTGQVQQIKLRAGESGTIYLVATDNSLHENMVLYRRGEYFSCLNPGKIVQ